MSGPAARRALAAIAAVCVVVSLLLAPAAQRTDAAFTDAEHAVAPELLALRVQTPLIVGTPTCNFTLNSRPLVVEWRWPQPGAPDATLSNAQWLINGREVVPAAPAGPDSNGHYRTTFESGLLTGVLGTNFVVELRTRLRHNGATTWSSGTVGRIDVSGGVLGLGSRCSVTNNAPPHAWR